MWCASSERERNRRQAQRRAKGEGWEVKAGGQLKCARRQSLPPGPRCKALGSDCCQSIRVSIVAPFLSSATTTLNALSYFLFVVIVVVFLIVINPLPGPSASRPPFAQDALPTPPPLCSSLSAFSRHQAAPLVVRVVLVVDAASSPLCSSSIHPRAIAVAK